MKPESKPSPCLSESHHRAFSRREFIKAAGSAGLALGLGSMPAFAADPIPRQRMNLVIITTDDNDTESLGCFGCPLPGITPNMDRLASGGVRFEHAHTPSPTCQPCRLSLMTGRYPQTNGATGHVDPLKPGVPTLTAELKKAGYFTAIIGAKQLNYKPDAAFGWDRGGDGDPLTPDTWDGGKDGYWTRWGSPEGFYKGTRELLAEAKGQGKPFFLHLNTSDPHRPWPGSVDEMPFIEGLGKSVGRKLKPLRPYPRNYSPAEVPVPGYLPDLPGVRVDLAEYYAGLHNADRAVGEMLKALEEAGVAESTIVVCFGDQGAAFPGSKQNLYRVSTRIPLIIRWPGQARPGSVAKDQMVSVIDLMPTLLEGLGLPPVEGMDGHSVLPVIRGEKKGGREFVHTSYNYAYQGVQCLPMRAVQSTEFLFIYNSWPGEKNIDPPGPLVMDGHMDPLTGLCWKSMKEAAATDPEIARRVEFLAKRVPEEFYDLHHDPWCLKNLIDDPEHRERIGAMRRMVEEQMERTGDPLLAKFRSKGPIPAEWRTLNMEIVKQVEREGKPFAPGD